MIQHQHGGISFQVAGQRAEVTRTPDGGIVLHAPTGATVEPLAGCDLWARNRSGRDQSELESSVVAHTMHPHDTLFLARRAPPAGQWGLWQRPDYWAEPSRSGIATMVPIVCVAWSRPAGPIFRPPAPGTGLLAQHLRGTPILRSRCRVDRLPRVIEWGEFPNAPTAAQLLRIFRDFHGELWDGWATDTRTPGLQNPGYGTAWASAVSQALCFLCSTMHVEAKRPLAEAMCQWGIDLAAAFGDGRGHYAMGGHMAGRLAMIVLAGHLIEGAESLLSVRQNAPVFGASFQEDAAFPAAPERWRHSTPIDWADSTPWSKAQRTNQRNYIDQVVGAQIGTGLAMRLMGRSAEMGAAHAETCRWWMGPPPESDPIRAAYQRNGVSPAWGQDYALGFGAGVCAAAWRQVT
jgi:hypothetical protein